MQSQVSKLIQPNDENRNPKQKLKYERLSNLETLKSKSRKRKQRNLTDGSSFITPNQASKYHQNKNKQKTLDQYNIRIITRTLEILKQIRDIRKSKTY